MRRILTIAVLALAAYLTTTTLHAQAPKDELQYQARLLDPLGQPINQTGVVITFRLYNFAVGGTVLYTEVEPPMNISDGLLNARIGPLPDGLVQSPGDLYLGVQINADAEMSPRLPIGSVPFALKAKEATLPAGTVLMNAGAAAPSGFLSCDGSAVLRSAYPELFATIGVAFGAGDGLTTFNLPDLRQRFPIGVAPAGTASSLGASGGQVDHVHAAPSHQHGVPTHTHGLASHTHVGPNHSHTMSHTHSVPAHFHSAQGSGADINIAADAGSKHEHEIGVREGSDSGGYAGSNRVLAAQVAGGTANNYGAGTVNFGEHTHAHSSILGRVGTVTGGSNGDAAMTSGGSSAGSTGNGGNQNTSGPSVSTTDGSTPFSTDAVSGGNTTSANPPFLALYFIIKT